MSTGVFYPKGEGPECSSNSQKDLKEELLKLEMVSYESAQLGS